MSILHRVVRFQGRLWKSVLVSPSKKIVLLYHPKRHFFDKAMTALMPLQDYLDLLAENKFPPFVYTDGFIYRVTERSGDIVVCTAELRPGARHPRWLITNLADVRQRIATDKTYGAAI